MFYYYNLFIKWYKNIKWHKNKVEPEYLTDFSQSSRFNGGLNEGFNEDTELFICYRVNKSYSDLKIQD